MKITGTINFELDDKDLKKRDVEVAGVVMTDMPMPPGLDDVARARLEKQSKQLHAREIRQRIKKLEEYMVIGNTVFEVLMQAGHGKLAELKAHLVEVEGTTPPEPPAA